MADEKAGSTVLGVGAAAGTTVAGIMSGDPLTATAGFLDLVQRAAEYYRARQERVVRRLLEEAYLANSSDSGAFSEFRALFASGDLKSESAKNVFLQTVRVAEAAVDEAVLPALAMLMRHYVHEGRRYDGFFRANSRLLQELSADEYASFAALVKGIAGARFDDGAAIQVDTVVASPREEWTTTPVGAPAEGEYVLLRSSTLGDSRTVAAAGCDPAHLARLSQLLDNGGFAERYSKTRNTGMYLEIRAGVARRIAAFVR
jgi:hypothetical protein